MTKSLKSLLAAVVLLVLAGVIVYSFFPDAIEGRTNSGAIVAAGSEAASADVDTSLDANPQNKAPMIQSQKAQHAARVQLYRWYTLYEREMSKARVANQLDILDENVKITSAAGTMEGRADYPDRLKVYEGWQNAHHVQNIAVTPGEGGKTTMEADIIYQNIQPDGKENAYTVHYVTELAEDGTGLPKFKSLNLRPTGELPARDFVDAYPTNRLKSLMHAWLLNVEGLDGNVEPFKELLTDDFYLNFSSGDQIDSVEKLEKWLNGAPMTLAVSSHYPINFSVETTGKNTYTMHVDFVWFGLAKDGNTYKAVTSHDWRVVDDPTERFARIKRADVTRKVPFGLL